MLVHRDARFFPRPLTFDPDRWLSTPAVPRSKCTYFPFGAGPRSCIGEGFAWMEGVLVLATLAQRWQLSAVHTGLLKVTPQLTLRPLRPLHVGLRRRS